MPSLQDDPNKQVQVLEYVLSKGLRACPVCNQAVLEENGAVGFGVGRDFAILYHEDHTEYSRFVCL